MDDAHITPLQAAKAFEVVLALSEQYERWDLLKAALGYIKEADGRVQRLGPSLYLIQYPKE